LVLLDIMMPVLDGYEVLTRLKSDMNLRDIPVLVISAVDEADKVVRCIQLGAEDYLRKPFNQVMLHARVAACLEKRRLRGQEAAYLRQIESEKRRVDNLLHAVLPPAAVRELKATNMVRPQRFEDVAVLFCDIVDFTAFCDSHPPEEVVDRLQSFVDRLEEVTANHGLVKIKTVGDAYLATGGLLNYVEEPLLAGVLCGLDMVAAVADLGIGWQVRVGVHSGPVVAGAVGRQHVVYDIWGDTVNTAARLTAEAPPGAVTVTAPLWPRLRGQVKGRSLGFVNLKGKGEIELVACTAS
jgi:adenylate cyclase